MVKKKGKIEEQDVDTYLKGMEEEVNILDKEVWQPEKIAEQKANEEAFKEIIRTEKEMLEAYPENNLTIRTELNGKILEFKVRPLEDVDAEDLEWLDFDKRVYRDSDELKKEVMNRKRQKKNLNSAEVESESGKKISEVKKMNKFLAIFVYPPSFNKLRNREKRNEARVNFWKNRIPLNFKKFLVEKTSEILGLDLEKEFKFFPVD